MFGVSVGADGFFIERHRSSAGGHPVEGCSSPAAARDRRTSPDTVAQERRPPPKPLAVVRGEVEMDAACAQVQEELAAAARMCNDLLPVLRHLVPRGRDVSRVNPAMCKACGTCVAACPSGALRALHFTDEQIYGEIEGILS